jgi:TonB family protein
VVLPKVPAWVGVQGLTLSVIMSFSVLPDGLVTGVATQRSSGYPDIDQAVTNALRQWRYSPSAGALLAKGRVSFVIRAH